MDQKFATLDDLSNHYRIFINRIQTQLSTMGGGGAGFIKDLDDVTFDQTTGQGRLLIYNGSKWVGIASTAVGGGAASELAENATGTNLVLSGNLTVAGIATYEDVKNIDSIGIVTARTGVDVLAGGINVTGVSTFNSDVNFAGDINGNVTIVSTDTGSSAAPELTLYRNSASPSPGDYLGQILFKGENSNGGEENYAKITGKIRDETLGTEDGQIETAIKGNGSFTIVSRQRHDELQLLNDVGLSVDGDTTLGTTSATSLTASAAFYMPQYTTTARDAASFNEGAMIYNTTTKKMEFYNGSSWQSLPGMSLGLTVALDG
tara:strand:- start:757 stop:1713 length:957 start_codon:yes stop_codon:yes gene_type:complete